MIKSYFPTHLSRKYCYIIATFYVLISLTVIPQGSHCIKLDSDGGYSLLIAVDDFSPKADVFNLNILSSIKENFAQLSKWMSSTTKKFYIKNVDILIPSTRHLKPDAAATYESYKNADVQITQQNSNILVRNPNGCGIPGENFKLPLQFFDDNSTHTHLDNAKILLQLFARYRWGVFEENGVVSDPQRYPRYYKGPTGESEDGKPTWMPTGCTNHRLVGSFISTNKNDSCDLYNKNGAPSDSCEFKLAEDQLQNATSSLMNQALLESMTEFCDKDTHNKLAPTPQNILCNYRSVMEVIRSTEDWNFAVDSNTDKIIHAQPKFKLLKKSTKPNFFLLLDRHLNSESKQTITQIGKEVGEIFKTLDGDVIAKIGAFPSEKDGDSVDILTPWSPSSELRSIAPKIIQKNFATGTKRKGNFASSLFELAKDLQTLGHPEGTVVLILKAGPATSFSKSQHAFENEIIASLKTAKVHFYALEIQPNATASGVNLKNVVEMVGGSHIVFGPSAQTKLKTFFRDINEKLGNSEEDLITEETVVIYKGYANGSDASSTYHPGGHLNSVHVYLSSWVPITGIMINSIYYPNQSSVEWNNDFGYGYRYTHYTEPVAYLLSENNTPLTVTYDCGHQYCEAYLVILGEIEGRSKFNELSTHISTSSLSNFLDWSDPVESSRPFHIYAEILNLFPIYTVQLTGFICNMNDDVCDSFPLVDDGQGEPDIMTNDGVYSSSIVPVENGKFYVKVVCNVFEKENPILTRTYDYDSILTFVGTENRKPSTIRKISDLRVSDKDDDSVELEWTAPVTYGEDGNELSADLYDLRYAARYTDLITDFDECHEPKLKSGLPKPSLPGTKQKVKVYGISEEDKDVYFAIRSSSSGIQSEASNLVSSALVALPRETKSQSVLHIDAEGVTEDSIWSKQEDDILSSSAEETTEESTTTEAQEPTTQVFLPVETKSQNVLNKDVEEVSDDPIWSNLLEQDPISISSSTEESTTTETQEPTTLEPTTQDPPTQEPTQEPTTDTVTPSSTIPTTTKPPEVKEEFFKKPIGYITAAVGAVIIVAIIGGLVGYLYWKRKKLIDSGDLRLIKNDNI